MSIKFFVKVIILLIQYSIFIAPQISCGTGNWQRCSPPRLTSIYVVRSESVCRGDDQTKHHGLLTHSALTTRSHNTSHFPQLALRTPVPGTDCNLPPTTCPGSTSESDHLPSPFSLLSDHKMKLLKNYSKLAGSSTTTVQCSVIVWHNDLTGGCITEPSGA